MKKMLVAFFALAMAASVATAAVGINWGTTWGVYDSGATDLTGSDGILNTYSVIWPLIYAGDNDAIEPPDASNVAGRYVSTSPSADDVVWAQRNIPQGGGAATYWSANDEQSRASTWGIYLDKTSGESLYEDLDWNTAGFVYQRVFEGMPALGSLYYDSELLPLGLAYTPQGGPQPFSVDAAGGGTEGVQPNRQIPEPATMSLLGLGALAMVLRRKLRK